MTPETEPKEMRGLNDGIHLINKRMMQREMKSGKTFFKRKCYVHFPPLEVLTELKLDQHGQGAWWWSNRGV